MKKHKRIDIFYSFLISYILVLTIPIALGSFAYQKAVSITQEEAINASLRMLEQSRNILDTRLREIQGLSQQISISTNVSKLITGFSDISINMNLSNDLSNYRINNSFISTCIIYIKDQNLIITPSSSTNREYLFYNNLFKSNDKDYETWKKEFWSKSYQGVFTPSIVNISSEERVDNEDGINYIQSLPIGNKDQKGMIIMDINVAEIKGLLGDIAGDDGWAYISNEQGDITISVNSNKHNIEELSQDFYKSKEKHGSITSKDFIVSYSVSPYNGWIYVTGHPTDKVMKKVNVIKEMTFAILIAVFLIGAIAVLTLANKNSRPIKNLLNTIRSNLNYMSEGISGNTFEFIQGSITELLRNNEELKNEIAEKIPILRAAFIDRLLRGSFNSMTELNKTMSGTGMELSAYKYSVIILKIEGCENTVSDGMMSELNMAKVVVSKVINSIFSDRALLHEISGDMLAVLLMFNFSDEEQIREAIRNIATEVSDLLIKNNNIHVSFSSGLAYSSLTDVYKSFIEAQEALDYKAIAEEDVVRWYYQSPDENSFYYYPIEIENKLINLAKSGDEHEIQTILQQLYEENIVRRKISIDMIDAFLGEIRGTLIKIVSRIKQLDMSINKTIKDKMGEVEAAKSIEKAWEGIIELYSLIANIASSEKNKSLSSLLVNIIEYLNASYTDQQLSRASVASKFNMTEVYLSRFFKDQTGENFSHYLEKIRMEKAKQLISETELPISEIAEQVGYTSARVFRRAYKRICGDLPSSLRQ